MELGEGDFLNVISFLEIRPRHTTVVALEKTEVGVITRENFGLFFRDQPAKVMSLLQHMSARIRMMEKNYLRASEALERHADMDKVKAEDGAWYKEHSGMYQIIKNMPSELIIQIPTGLLDGPYTLRITTQYSSSNAKLKVPKTLDYPLTLVNE